MDLGKRGVLAYEERQRIVDRQGNPITERPEAEGMAPQPKSPEEIFGFSEDKLKTIIKESEHAQTETPGITVYSYIDKLGLIAAE